jgi:amino acid transporter
VGTAAKLGSVHIVFWLLAAALFYLPQAAVVIFLSRLMPLEGGVYQWAYVALGKFGGFLVAWNLWAYAILILATFGVIVATNVAYLVGPQGAWLTGTSWYTAGVSVLAIVATALVALLGLRIGKWVQNVGGAAQFLSFGALIAIPFVAVARGTLSAYHPLATSLPTFTAYNLNIFGKLAIGAFSGFEYVALLAGECRSPRRGIGQSVLIAAPIIATMFILGTSSVLALVPTERIDLVSPIPQAITLGLSGFGTLEVVGPALILLIVLRQLGNMTLIFTGSTRLPLVAGWDSLLPAWFTRIHPRFRTPTNSILFVALVTLIFTLAGQLGVGVQEAFQLLDNAAGIFYAFTYAALFAIPLFAAARLTERPPLWLRVAAAAGLGVTVLYSVLSVFPIIEVASWRVFTAKVVAVLAGVNLLGLAIYGATRRRSPREKSI